MAHPLHCEATGGYHVIVWHNRRRQELRCLRCRARFPATIRRNKPKGKRLWNKCTKCHKAKRDDHHRVCVRCRRSYREKSKSWLTRTWLKEIGNALLKCGTVRACELALEQAIAAAYCTDGWECYDDIDRRWLINKFRKQLEFWLLDKDTSWTNRWQFIRAMMHAASLRDAERIKLLNHQPISDHNQLKPYGKETVAEWVRSLVAEGFLTLDDIDPPPLYDDTNYDWLGSND